MKPLTLLCAVALVTAANMPSEADAPSAEELVAKNIEARGGAAKLKAIESVRIERTVAALFTDIELVIYKKRPNLYRSEQKPKGAPAPTIRGFAETAWETAAGKTMVRQGAGSVEQREVDADFEARRARPDVRPLHEAHRRERAAR